MSVSKSSFAAEAVVGVVVAAAAALMTWGQEVVDIATKVVVLLRQLPTDDPSRGRESDSLRPSHPPEAGARPASRFLLREEAVGAEEEVETFND